MGSTIGPMPLREAGQGRAALAWLVLAVGIAAGIVVEAVSFGMDDPVAWVPDLGVGLTCIGCGLLIASRVPSSRTGWLLAVAGFAWFVGNLSAVQSPFVAALAAQFVLLYRAVLVHAVLTMPGGRAADWPQRVVVATGYVAWSVPWTENTPPATAGMSLLVVGVAVLGVIRAPRPQRKVRVAALVGTIVLAIAFTTSSIAHAAVPSGALDSAVLISNEVAVSATAIMVAVVMHMPLLIAPRVSDLLVEATHHGSERVRDELARALGDPSLQLGYWRESLGQYLDARAEPVLPPGDDDRRVSMRVEVDGRPVAMILHDPAVIDDGELGEAVRTATRLAAENARLRSDVMDQLAEARASRRRLVVSSDAQRAQLSRAVERGPVARARMLQGMLGEAASAAQASGAHPLAEEVAGAQRALDQVVADLVRLSRGLHPAALDGMGLAQALGTLAERSPVPVAVSCEAGGMPEAVEVALYYVSAEAVANAVKHARASAVSVTVASTTSGVGVSIVDDGVGGADPSGGTGLRGIEDRVEALGGRVVIRSEPKVGTVVFAEIPSPTRVS